MRQHQSSTNSEERIESSQKYAQERAQISILFAINAITRNIEVLERDTIASVNGIIKIPKKGRGTLHSNIDYQAREIEKTIQFYENHKNDYTNMKTDLL